MDILIDAILLALLAAIAVALVWLRHMFAVVMFFGSYTFVSALLFVTLDAVDVAFTEAAVGAGVSTILLLGTLALTTNVQKAESRLALLPLTIVIITGAALIYGTLQMPLMGNPENAVHQHVAPRYIETSPKEVGIPNMVTSVLASYRGFDTLGEVVVIFAAGVGVLALVGGNVRPTRSRANDDRKPRQ
ncbi:MAG: DUF4040 domain-containing protein [Candidatus Competibacterales bacterium]